MEWLIRGTGESRGAEYSSSTMLFKGRLLVSDLRNPYFTRVSAFNYGVKVNCYWRNFSCTVINSVPCWKIARVNSRASALFLYRKHNSVKMIFKCTREKSCRDSVFNLDWIKIVFPSVAQNTEMCFIYTTIFINNVSCFLQLHWH